jgi:DNA-binding NarL/FixJ family response regulator
VFNFLTDSIENALTVANGFVTGEDVTKRQVAKLIADGVTVAGAAALLDVSVDTIKRLLDD